MKNSPKLMFFFGVATFAIIIILTRKKNLIMESHEFWFYIVLIALATSAISMFIPGMLQNNYDSKNNEIGRISENKNEIEPITLAEKQPNIIASGAITIFVLVYLISPIR